MLRHLRPQIALALAGLGIVGLLLYIVSRQAFVHRPARGGTLVEAVVGPPATINPVLAISATETDIVRLVFSGLTRIDPTGEVLPDLAERWSVSENGRVYTFKLRPGARWHDGAPVTVDDVVFTARVAASRLPHKATLAAAWEGVRAEAVDRETVRLTLPEPHAPFLYATSLGLLPAHILGGVDVRQLAQHRFSTLEPIGCGPYQVIQPGGVSSDAVQLRRFEAHWRNDGVRPYLDGIVFRIHATRAEALESLVRRNVQTMGGVPAQAFDALSDDVRLYSVTRFGLTLVYWNPANSLLADPVVRRALSLASDRAGIIQDVLAGQAIPASGPFPPGSWAHDERLAVPEFAPHAVAELLDGASWLDSDGDGVRDKDGRNLTFELDTTSDPILVALATRLSTDWRQVGIDARVRVLDQQAAVDALSRRAFDAFLFAWEQTHYDPDPFFLWHSSQAERGQNYAGWRDSVADDLIMQGRHLLPNRLDLRRAVYQRFERRFAEQLPALVLYHPVYTYAVVDPNLGGVQMPQLLVEPADRFFTLPNWYLRSERIVRGLHR